MRQRGLRSQDIDLEAGTVTIATQHPRSDGGMIVGDPKWNSHRMLAAPDVLLELLG